MSILHRVVYGLGRRLGAWPLRLLNSELQAEVIENVRDAMITTVEIPRGHIRFFAPNTLLMRRARKLLTKEIDTIEWIDGFRDNDVFWDIGANVGAYSLYAAIQKRVSVVSFEPSAANYYALTRNIQMNGVSDQVIAYCLAFAGRTRAGLLNITSSAMGAALSQFGNRDETSPYWKGSSKTETHGMLGFSIDDFLHQFDPPFPNHLKLDVDGLEFSILEGAQNTLNDSRLKSVLVEVNLKDTKEKQQAFQILCEAGLYLKSQGENQGTQTEKVTNHVFEKGFGARSVVGPQTLDLEK